MSKHSEELVARIQRIKEETQSIQMLWESLFPEFPAPDYLQCSIWLKRHSFQTVVDGLEAGAVNHNKKSKKWTAPELVRYASACMIKKEEA
jgi:hypothetical protein